MRESESGGRNLIERAIAWVEEREATIAQYGRPLDELEVVDARAVGVKSPDLVRVLEVDAIELPTNAELRGLAEASGAFSDATFGMTFGHGICMIRGRTNRRRLSHELRHVYQYEEAGSVAQFIPVYLSQVLSVGYVNSPLEVDARAHEIRSE